MTGQKIWTSFGRRANWCFLLARTGPTEVRHRGISFFVASMDTPGIEWRPILEITGSEDFGELFLDELRIPGGQLIGAEGDGWRVAMSSLGHERLLATNTAHVQIRFEALVDLARRHRISPSNRDRITTCQMRLVGLQGLQQQALEFALAEDSRFPVWSSMVKLAGTELRRDIAELATRILGVRASVGLLYGQPLDADDEAAVWEHELLHSRAATIYAGSSEIQRNIIAERGLDLPRESR